MIPNLMPNPQAPTPDELLAEVLTFRPEIERILAGDRRSDPAALDDRVQIVLLNVARHLNSYQPH